MFNNSFNLGVSISALLVCIVNLIYTFIERRTDKTQNRIFISMICILIVNSISGMITGIYGDNPGESGYIYQVFQVSKYAYFVTHTALCPLFFYYVCCLSFVSNKMKSMKAKLIFMPFFITEILAVTNPLTHYVWSYKEGEGFHREWGEFLIYIAALIYYILSFVILGRTWKVISGKRKAALVFFFALVGVGVFLQLIKKDFKVEVLAEAVGFTGVLIAVENEDDRIDFGMGFYNRAALRLDIGSCLRNRRDLHIIIIYIHNYDLIDRIVGDEDTNIIADILSDYLKSITKRYHIYVPDKDKIVMTFYSDVYSDADRIAERIAERFDETWIYKDYTVQFNVSVILADLPDQITSTSELFYMIENPVPADNEKKVLKGEDLQFIMRRRAVESALSRGFTENSYEVYYQPTYHINRRLHGAEALIRMHDGQLGNLYPDEFIPVAERCGLIDDIDDFVLEEVCRFVSTGIPQKCGIDNINVNLSVIQCMRPHFVERINEIVERYNVEKSFINFEITETIAANDYEILSGTIQRLKEEGFLFSMDDYGTGYSNVSAIFSLNLDVIKIDKSLLWGAEKSELGMVILENTIRMICQMKKKILVEGVETLEQIRLLEKLGVDFLQGYYFSKPIPKDDFIKHIEKASAAVR